MSAEEATETHPECDEKIALAPERNVRGFGISFDLETTGLGCHTDRLVQLGAAIFAVCDDDSLHIVRRLQLNCCCPEVRMHPKSIEVCKISQAFVDAQKRSAQQLLERFAATVRETCDMHPAAPRALVVYNAPFDAHVLGHEAARSGLGVHMFFRMLRLTSVLDVLVAARACVDTTQLPRNAKGRCMYNLGEVYRALLGRPLLGAHGGLADAEAVVEVLRTGGKELRACLDDALRGATGRDCLSNAQQYADTCAKLQGEQRQKRACGIADMLKAKKRKKA